MKIVIDEKSGCCNGVGRAIDRAESYLSEHPYLYSLGAIVHNDTEINRLAELGLRTIGYADMEALSGETVLIRAHGEPPATYLHAAAHNIDIIDCTCPVVLALQKKIARKYAEFKSIGGTILIFGKQGHAEVNGLVGQTEGNAIVIGSPADLQHKFDEGAIALDRPIALFSQTTKDPEEFVQTVGLLKELIENAAIGTSIETLDDDAMKVGLTGSEPQIYNTICKHVSSRHQSLRELAANCDIIIFVCGKESSNGKVLFELCRSINPRSYKIETAEELDPGIFDGVSTVGLCGATSTTRWQIDKVAEHLRTL